MQYENWEVRDFSQGYIDKLDDNLLPENACSDCQNFISRRIGSLKKRPGQGRLQNSGVDMVSLVGPILGLYSYYYGNPLVERRLIIAANGEVKYWDGTSISNLNSGLSTTQQIFFETCANYLVAFSGVDAPWKWDGTTVSPLLNAPPTGRYPTLHKEKLFVVPILDPSTLYWSESFAPEDWPAVNFWPIKEGDGDKITNLQKFLGELVIFKGRSIHSLRGSHLGDFRLDEIESSVGCAGPRAAVSYKNFIYFISEVGIHVFNGMKAENISLEIIPELWESVNKEHIHKAVAGVWDGLIWFALPEGTSETNNLVLIYEPTPGGLGKFWIWRGINISCIETFDDGGDVSFYSGDYGGYVNQQYVGTADFGSDINAYWESKSFDIGRAAYEKKARKVFVEDSPAHANNDVGVATLKASLDGAAFNTLIYRTDNRLVREYAFNTGIQWRNIKFRIEHTGMDECEIRSILMPFRYKRRPRVKEIKMMVQVE